MSTIGKNIKLTIFGESHGPYIGCVLDGLGAGYLIDKERIKKELLLRAPINGESMRVESDEFEIVSGEFQGFTTGKPLTIIIPNKDVDNSKYEELNGVPRPGSADFVNYLKSRGFYDYLGGGHSSGRISAGIVAAGAIIRQILEQNNVYIFSHITKMGSFVDETKINDENIEEMYLKVRNLMIPILNDQTEEYQKVLEDAKNEKDSLGGEIETFVLGTPLGLGDSWFDSLQGKISAGIMSISGVKGIAFGEGFNFSSMKGSESNDSITVVEDSIDFVSNHNGGISGGISTSQPIVFKTVCKPTPSIGKPQTTVDLNKQENKTISLEGRFDPTITRKVCAVINSITSLIIADAIAERFGLINFTHQDADDYEEN